MTGAIALIHGRTRVQRQDPEAAGPALPPVAPPTLPVVLPPGPVPHPSRSNYHPHLPTAASPAPHPETFPSSAATAPTILEFQCIASFGRSLHSFHPPIEEPVIPGGSDRIEYSTEPAKFAHIPSILLEFQR